MSDKKTYVYVCVGCGKNEKDLGVKSKGCGQELFEQLQHSLSKECDIEVIEAPCLSNCKRGVSVGLSARHKYHWLFGEKSNDQDDHDALIKSIQAYHALSDGFIEKANRAMPVIARIPPLKD